MTDKVKNYYELLPKDLKQERKVDANFKKHYIQPCSMICCIGGTGSGKTNALIDFLNRKNNAFYDIIIFSGSTVEEPLYNLLKQKCQRSDYLIILKNFHHSVNLMTRTKIKRNSLSLMIS